jgi:hypothetical protein
METALVAATAVTKVPTRHKRPELRLVKAAA